MSIAENTLRPLFKKLSGPITQSLIEKKCDFAEISIANKQTIYGIKETGEIIETISNMDFAAANSKISEMISDGPNISQFVNSILVYIEGEHIIAKVKSKILGNMNFKFEINEQSGK